MYTLLPKLLKKYNPEDADAYKAVEDLNEALTQAKCEGIRNIALTGPYGSGKSSVLKTLMNDFKENRHYLSISLATLQSDDDLPEAPEDKKEEKREILNRRIEYSILQQLIYKEKSSTVPSSRFKRIAHFTKRELIQYAFWIVGFVICFCIAFEPHFARIESMYDIFDWGRANTWIDLAAILYMLFCFGYVIRYFIQGYSNSKLNKLNLKDGEIDIKEDTSIFNKHLDEIIYFFRATPYDVVIIEDLDRFETPDIYLKLRELNQLINESEEINRHIVFVYAVKDDVFVDQARTKFFDYIITIIPVINPSNSKAILKQELLASGLQEGDISDDDIAGIAFFIQEMRILRNIVHEFTDYRIKLIKGEQQLDLAKLLAMIVYKNYHPKDFALLHKRDGKVYKCISKKPDFIRILTKDIEQRRDEIIKKGEKQLQEDKLNISELRLLFLYDVSNSFSYKRIESIEVCNSYRTLPSIANNDIYFNEFLSLKRINYSFYHHYNSSTTSSDNIDISEKYNRSAIKKRIDDIIGESRKQIKMELAKVENDLVGMKDLPLAMIISNNSVRASDLFKSLGLTEMMEVFLIEGYLDEDYYDYISYFYPGMISPSDRDYLMSIKRLFGKDYTRHIDKIENFVKELRPNNFNTENVLNVEVLDFLVENQHISSLYRDYYLRFIQVIENDGFNLSFLSAYYTHSNIPEKFFKSYLGEAIDELWNHVCENETGEQGLIIECILKYGANLNSKIFDWIVGSYQYIREHKVALGSSRIGFFNKTVKYSNLDSEDNDLINAIAKTSAYEINPNNLTIIISIAYGDPDILQDSLSFDLIRNCPNKQVSEYLLSEDNLKQTYKSLSGKVKEESIDSIDFILQSSLDVENKRNYLTGQVVKRDNLEGLSEEEQRLVIECNLLKPTWTNIDKAYTIFQNQEDILSTCINKNIEALSEVDSAVGIKNEAQLFDLLFGDNNTLNMDGYRSLISAFECVCEGNQYLCELDSDRFDVLLNNGCIPFDLENLGIINGTTFLSRYLIYNSSSFMSHLDWDYSFSTTTLIDLLQSEKFTQHEKNLILEKAGASLILSNAQLATISAGVIADTLSDSKFNIAELRSIIEISNNLEANIKLATHIIASEALCDEDISQVLRTLKEDKFVQLSERRKQPKFKKLPILYNLLRVLQNRHFISSITEKDEVINPNYYKSK